MSKSSFDEYVAHSTVIYIQKIKIPTEVDVIEKKIYILPPLYQLNMSIETLYWYIEKTKLISSPLNNWSKFFVIPLGV